MSDKVLIGIIVAILIFVIVLICIVANSMSNDGTRYEAKTPGLITKQEEESVEKKYSKMIDDAEKINSKYKSSTLNEEYVKLSEDDRKYVDDQVDKVLGWINTNNTDELYENHLAVDYKNAKFPDKEELGEFINEYFPNSSSYGIRAYEVQGASLFLPIVKDDDVTNQQIMDVKIVNYLTDEFELYFDNVQDIMRLMNKYDTNKFRIVINYGIEANNYCSFLLKITNNDNQDEIIDFSNTKMAEKDGKRYQYYESIGETKVLVPKGQTVLFELKFKKYKIYPREIDFDFQWGGKSYTYEMYLNFRAIDDDE